MESNQIASLLTILLVVFMVILFILIMVYIVISHKNKVKNQENKKNKESSNNDAVKNKNTKSDQALSIYDFMEFKDIQDNMIIQKDHFKYIMVVECQGVNYDLMSEIEKTGVEEGFLQFLNTLRHPVQLYVQTRTVNLEGSINTYKSKVAEIETELFRKKQEYAVIKDNPDIPEKEKQKMLFALVKQTNLYEYGKDVIADTEKMSLNKNILNKKYYVIIPYYPTDIEDNDFDSYEIKNIAFSELYTRSQAVIRTLAACGVKGKILNCKELIDLLYVAYNRDHQEEFNLDMALKAQYDKLYSTAEDVYQKKIRALDQKIENEAIERAKDKLKFVKSEAEKAAIKKQNEIEDLIDEMAKLVLEANRKYIEEETLEQAINEIEKDVKVRKTQKKKEVMKDAKKEETRATRTKK